MYPKYNVLGGGKIYIKSRQKVLTNVIGILIMLTILIGVVSASSTFPWTFPITFGEEGTNASMSISDGFINFGNSELGDTVDTVSIGDTQIINTTEADGAQLIEIRLNSSTVTGQVNSTVLTFVSGSVGENEMKCSFKGGDVGAYTSLNTTYQIFDNSLPPSTVNLDIQVVTPSSVTNDDYYDYYQFDIIVRATLL